MIPSTIPLFAFRFSLPKGLTAAPDVACRTSFTSSTVENSHDLRKSLSASAHVSGGGWGVSFSASTEYKKSSSFVQSGKYKLVLSTASCKYYFTKLNELELPDFSPEMLEWMGRMNESVAKHGAVDDNLLYDFVEYFGTHFSTETVYGARFTYESRVSSSKYSSMQSEELSVEAKASYSGLFSVSGGFGLSSSQQAAASEFKENSVSSTISIGAPPPYNGDALTWASTVKETPVPVEYNLKPLYDLFDIGNPTISKYFSEDVMRKIRNKITSIASKYCRMLESKGINVQCNDDSVIKIADYVLSESNRNGVSNKSLDACIMECTQRRLCDLASYSPTFLLKGGEIPFKCGIDDQTTTRRKFFYHQGSTSFVDPISIKNALGLHELRYELRVQRVNGMFISGSSDFETLNFFCTIACSFDEKCVGFEVSNKSYYNNNCAMYREHSQNLIETEQYHFETYIMSETAKRRLKKTLELKFEEFTDLGFGDSGSSLKLNCDYDCCEQHCQGNVDCLVLSSVNTTCGIVVSDNNNRNNRLIKVDQMAAAKIKFFPAKAEQGWLNFTSSASFGKIFEDKSYPAFNLTSVDSANACAKHCTMNVTCFAASWELFNSCIIVSLNGNASPKTNISTSVQLTDGFKLMVPTYEEKIRQFRNADQI